VLPSSVEKYNVETVAVDTLILDSCRVERVALLPCINCTVRELPCIVEKNIVDADSVDVIMELPVSVENLSTFIFMEDTCRVEIEALLPTSVENEPLFMAMVEPTIVEPTIVEPTMVEPTMVEPTIELPVNEERVTAFMTAVDATVSILVDSVLPFIVEKPTALAVNDTMFTVDAVRLDAFTVDP